MNQNRSQNSVSWAQNMPKMRWRPGGAYSAPPYPLAAIRGPTSKGRGGEERGGEGKGREGGTGGSRHTNPHLLPAPMPHPIPLPTPVWQVCVLLTHLFVCVDTHTDRHVSFPCRGW